MAVNCDESLGQCFPISMGHMPGPKSHVWLTVPLLFTESFMVKTDVVTIVVRTTAEAITPMVAFPARVILPPLKQRHSYFGSF